MRIFAILVLLSIANCFAATQAPAVVQRGVPAVVLDQRSTEELFNDATKAKPIHSIGLIVDSRGCFWNLAEISDKPVFMAYLDTSGKHICKPTK